MTGVAIDALDDPGSVADALVANQAERRSVGCTRLLLAAKWADTHPALPGQRSQQVGSQGVPEIAQLAVEEMACVLGVSPHAAQTLTRDALNLRHRHPRLWERIGAFEVEDWVATMTARKVAAAELDLDQAQWVDEQTAPHLTAMPVGRYLELVEAKIIEADEAAAEARREEAMRARFVRKGRRTAHGTKGIYGRATFGEIDNLYAVVDRLAQILLLQGDNDTADIRRSKALAILATPERVLELFAWAEEHVQGITEPLDDEATGEDQPPLPAPSPSGAPRSKSVIHVHVSLEAITAGFGIARIEEVGPIALAAIRELLGHTNVTIKPVVDLTVNASVDGYEIPGWLREVSRERFPFEVFPYGTTPARDADQDHSVSYVSTAEGGPPGQTAADNLGPLGRRAHRIKTFGKGWRHIRVGPRSFLWRTPTGYWLRVDPDGSQPLGKSPSHMEEHLRALSYAG